MIPAALAQPITADGLIVNGATLLRGWSIFETGGTDPGLATFYDGRAGDTSRPVAYAYTAKSTGGGPGLFPGLGILCRHALSVDVTLAGGLTVYYTPAELLTAELGELGNTPDLLTGAGLAVLLAKLGPVYG